MPLMRGGARASRFAPTMVAAAAAVAVATTESMWTHRHTAVNLGFTASAWAGQHQQRQHRRTSDRYRHDHERFRPRRSTQANLGGRGGATTAYRRRTAASAGWCLRCSEKADLPRPVDPDRVVTAWRYEGSAVDVPWRDLGDVLFEMGACSCSVLVGKHAGRQEEEEVVGHAEGGQDCLQRNAMLTFIVSGATRGWDDVGAVLEVACALTGGRDSCFESLDWEEGPLECGAQWEATRLCPGFDSVVMRRLHISPVQREETLPIARSRPDCPLRPVKLLEGQGWGDGEHPSTWLCLDFLETTIKGGEQVVDLGTGSGVLAVAAAVLGAERVVAIDIDVEILIHAKQNFMINGVADKVSAVHSREISIGDLSAEVVVANMIAGPMRRQMAALVLAVKEGGLLCLSGLRPSDVPLIRSEFGKYMDWDDSLEATHENAASGTFVRLVGEPKHGLAARGALRVELERELSDVAVA